MSEINELPDTVINWCKKYSILFHVIYEDKELRDCFRQFSAYSRMTEHEGIQKILHECIDDAYESGVVNVDYGLIIKEASISEENLSNPAGGWVSSLSKEQIWAVIAWHFRRDHFLEGSLISDSIANGHMMVLVDDLMKV